MPLRMNHLLFGTVVLALSASPAWADDCNQPTAAMMVSAKTPYSETIVSLGPGGQTMTSHMIQTETTKYVERNGRWTSLAVSSAELVDGLNEMLKTAKLSCKRAGTERVNGQSATVYTLHMEYRGDVTDSTMWISSQNLPLKSDTSVNGQHYSATYDYDHVQPPAGVKPLGQR